MYNGNQSIDGIYVGDQQVNAIYIGNEQVYGNGGSTKYVWTFDSISGSPTIVDGVYSGFDTNVYMTIHNPNIVSSDFELNFKFKTGNTVSWQSIMTSSGEYAPEFYRSPQVQLSDSGNISFRAPESLAATSWGIDISSSVTLSPDTTYTFNAKLSNGTVTCTLFDGFDTLLDTFYGSIQTIAMGYNATFGVGSTISTAHFLGEFDTNTSYIKFNNSLISNIVKV